MDRDKLKEQEPKKNAAISVKPKESRRYEAEEDEDEEQTHEDLGLGSEFDEIHEIKASPEDVEFDSIVGAMQEILVSDEFQDLSENFVRQYCSKFVETEENSHEMWMIHKKYKTEIEGYLDKNIKKAVPSYTPELFMSLLSTRKDQLDDFIVDTLTSFDNFLEFKRQALEVRLRQLKEEEPDVFRRIAQEQADNKMIQEILSGLEMQSDIIGVRGLQGEEYL